MALFGFFKKEKLIDICRKWKEWGKKIRDRRVLMILSTLCEEGKVEVNRHLIQMGKDKAFIETFDEVIEIDGARELIDFIKEYL
jgi:hypothetical protein